SAQAENEEFLKTIDENMQKIIKEQVKEQFKTSYAVVADLSEMELKKIIIKKMEGNKSIHRSDEQRNLYKALVEAYESDKIILDTYRDTVTLKRRRDDDADKDEEPSAGSDRGSKRRRERKEPESAIAPQEKATRSTTHEMKEPSHLEFETGADDQPIAEPSQHPEWFSQQKKPPTPDRDWNETLPATHIKVDTLTPELLAGPTYELMKVSCKSLVELEFFLEEVYKETTDQLDWVNPKGQESARDVYSKCRIIAVTKLKIVKWHSYKHLDWITLTNLTVEERFAFNVSLRMFTRSILIQRCVKDLQLGVESYQKKLNLTRPDTYYSDLKRKEAYIAYFNPRGFIYQNKDKHNRLMRIDELHKFSDGMLTDVRTALDDCLKGIQMKYMPQTIWRKSDKERAATMIQARDKQLKTRRIMRSLERFVGGRLYEGDFRMLQRTIQFII
nr:hypothetical protein [Tanacetum cinerariifolium]